LRADAANGSGLAQKLAGHLHEYGMLREPEIGRGGGQDVVLFVHLAGQRFRLHSGLHHGGGFGGAGFAQQHDGGQFAQLRILLLLRHRQPRFGLAQQFVEIGDFFRRLGLRTASLRAGLLVFPAHDPRHNGRRHDPGDFADVIPQPTDEKGERHEDAADDDVTLFIHRKSPIWIPRLRRALPRRSTPALP
jgi:hypothetical protein